MEQRWETNNVSNTEHSVGWFLLGVLCQRRAESPMVFLAQGNALGKRYLGSYALQGQL